MKKTRLLPALLPLVLTQCIDPMYGGGPGYGPGQGGPGGYPYNDPHRRAELREQGTDLNRMAYERGLQDGRDDAQQRQSQNFNRHRNRFDRGTEMAYRDGYNQSYSQANSSLGAYANPGSGYVPPPAYPSAPQAPARDPSYNMGYDYGLRDLTSGRVADPGAHVGRYDPRYRSSFERGYYDAHNSRAGQNADPSGRGGSQWFR